MAAAVTQRHLNDDDNNFTKSIKSQSNWKILVVTQRCVSGFISSVELGHVRPKSFQRWRIVLSLRRLGPAHDAKRRIISSTSSCLVSPAIETSLTFIQLVCFAPIISYLCIGSHLVFFVFFFKLNSIGVFGCGCQVYYGCKRCTNAFLQVVVILRCSSKWCVTSTASKMPWTSCDRLRLTTGSTSLSIDNMVAILNDHFSCRQHRYSHKYVVLDCSAQMSSEIIINHVKDVHLGRRNYHYLLSGLVSFCLATFYYVGN